MINYISWLNIFPLFYFFISYFVYCHLKMLQNNKSLLFACLLIAFFKFILYHVCVHDDGVF